MVRLYAEPADDYRCPQLCYLSNDEPYLFGLVPITNILSRQLFWIWFSPRGAIQGISCSHCLGWRYWTNWRPNLWRTCFLTAIVGYIRIRVQLWCQHHARYLVLHRWRLGSIFWVRLKFWERLYRKSKQIQVHSKWKSRTVGKFRLTLS